MTTKFTTKDLNRGNCTNDTCEYHELNNDCKAYNAKTGKIRAETLQAQKITAKVGCASHPLALQVLAGPVIKELEGWAHINAQSCLDTNGNSLFAVEVGALKLKLAELLKEGVKK